MLRIPKNVPSPWYRLGCLNWEGDYPYAPDVQFRLWHDGEHLYIEYQVSERTVRALQDQPGQAVFKDSCVEFFIMPAPLTDRHYYNFEWNAGGVLYLACRTSRQDPEPAPPQVLASVRAESSLGPAPFPERPFEGTWTMKVTIPCSALFRAGIQTWEGLRAKANVYKCGDGLQVPHFLTWAPIDTPAPDYHRPEFFDDVIFE